MVLKTALSRREGKIPAINNPTAGLSLTQELGNTKTTPTLGCYIWPGSWVTQKLLKHRRNNPKNDPNGSTHYLGQTK